MIKLIKQIFCSHIYKDTKTQPIRTVRELTGFVYVNYRYYSINQKCVKCEKERIIQKRAICIY